ncbi:hypothetical protein G9A89_002775 [Geosiphon pyriformis]|nr:hypothetical protein G9A89_002775 [Geosiphon pyriformis]
MTYASIAKLVKFTNKKDDAQVWLNDIEKAIAANGWNNARAMQAIPYFLQSTANSCSILQCVHLLYPIDLQAAVTNAQDFEAAKLKANHAQVINLVMNRLFELDSKLKQFITSIIVDQSTVATRNAYLPLLAISSELHTYDSVATLSFTNILNTNLSTDNINNLSATVTTHLSAAVSGNLLTPTNSNTTTELTSKRNPKAEIDPTKLEIVDEDAQLNNLETNQQPTLTSNIPPATITENKLLDTIFPFKFKEPLTTLLFSGAALEENPIMAIYTDIKVDSHFIKLILDIDYTASAKIITTDGATKTPIGKIDDFPIEVNGIIVPIKVLVIEATQYQALVENDWLSKTNALLDWNMQELQISQNKEKKSTWEAYQVFWANTEHNKLLPVPSWDDNNKRKQSKELTWKADQAWETNNNQEEQINWE